MEQELNPDRIFETDTPEAEQKDAPGTGASGSIARGGATDLFATLPSAPAVTSTTPTTPLPASLPVVHEVVFRASPATPEKSDQFRQLLQPAAPPPHPPEPVPSVPRPAFAAEQASGGFTQLLRALNYDQIKSDHAKTVAAFAETAMPLPKAEDPAPRPVVDPAANPNPAASPNSETLVQSALRSFAETSPVVTQAPGINPGVNSPASPVAASFTQLFTIPDSKPAAEPVISREPERVPPAAAQTDSFTQIFQALNTPATAPVPTPPPSSSDASPGSFTRMFQTLSDPLPAAEPVHVESFRVEAPRTMESIPTSGSGEVSPSAPPDAGSFTQLFRALDQGPSAKPASVETPQAQPTSSASREPSVPQGPSTALFSTAPDVVEGAKTEAQRAISQLAPSPSFSQMLRSLDAPPTEPLRATPPSASQPAPATAGSFTQMFRSLDTLPPEPAAPGYESSAEPGSFTRMFSAPSTPAVEASRPTPPPPSQGSSFTQLFGSLPSAPEQARPIQQQEAARTFGDYGRSGSPFAQDAGAGYGSPPARVSQTPLAAPAGGGLTQLLRTLDQAPNTTPQPAPEPYRPASPQQGAFTSTYGALDGQGRSQAPAPSAPQVFAQPAAGQDAAGRDATQAFRVPASPTPLAAAPISAGPSEFTRILNASAFRENALRNGEAAAPASAPAAQGEPAVSFGAPGFAAPKLPSVSVSPLKIPSGGGAPASPHLSVQGLPAAPHIPAVKVDLPKPAVPVAGKMQQLLPLLLIMIIFLLVAILIAVVFLMKR